MAYIKNIDHEKVLRLADEIAVQPGQIVSKTLAQNDAVSVTLFAFSQGEEIGTHDSTGDAFVHVLEGRGGTPWAARSTSSTPVRCSSCPRRSPTRCTRWRTSSGY